MHEQSVYHNKETEVGITGFALVAVNATMWNLI